MQNIELVQTAFSITDAEGLEMSYSNFELRVNFFDWKGSKVTLVFQDCGAHRLQECFDLNEGEWADQTYRVLESPWLEQHILNEDFIVEAGFEHYCLFFNEIGRLDVLSSGFELRT
ncbi:TPA: hypothetical protein NGV36_004503 [Vibrio parahaemolyticus]|nr:hypothetical protein [Vibrio parahaemolyticus]ODX45112.1 hypothetical protein BBM05_16395 [Vibrio parahaemolyticus]HCE2934305.1 hypothetical protein [Vibrio parahaemolyticus]HCG7660857.1 hypothetical protein [Vibrio parahaemolyticus]HCH5267759.1 hypothetical protein [Vibrio parahaemolyticus]